MIKKSQIQLKKKTPHQTHKSGQLRLTYQTCKPC
jgi:hypothetical protein